MGDKNDDIARDALKQQIRLLEGDLLEFIDASDLEYLRRWSFEYADRLSKRVGIDIHHPNYDYMQTLTRYDIMKKYWHEVDEFARENSDKDYVSIHVSLPKFRDINQMIEKKLNHKRGKLRDENGKKR